MDDWEEISDIKLSKYNWKNNIDHRDIHECIISKKNIFVGEFLKIRNQWKEIITQHYIHKIHL